MIHDYGRGKERRRPLGTRPGSLRGGDSTNLQRLMKTPLTAGVLCFAGGEEGSVFRGSRRKRERTGGLQGLLILMPLISVLRERTGSPFFGSGFRDASGFTLVWRMRGLQLSSSSSSLWVKELEDAVVELVGLSEFSVQFSSAVQAFGNRYQPGEQGLSYLSLLLHALHELATFKVLLRSQQVTQGYMCRFGRAGAEYWTVDRRRDNIQFL